MSHVDAFGYDWGDPTTRPTSEPSDPWPNEPARELVRPIGWAELRYPTKVTRLGYLPIVPVEFQLERLVLGWRIEHDGCTTPDCKCRLTPLAMKWGFFPNTYGAPCHELIAKHCAAVVEAGERVTPEAYETVLTLGGDWKRCGGWTYWSKLICASVGMIAAEHFVEKAAYRLIRLGQSRVAVEKLVELAEGHREADTEALEHVREHVRDVGRVSA